MINNKGNLKLSWREIFSDSSGKTSSSSFIGVISSVVCLILFITLSIFYCFNTGEGDMILKIIDRTTNYFTISAALMGVKSITNIFRGRGVSVGGTQEKKKHVEEEIEETEEEETPADEQQG